MLGHATEFHGGSPKECVGIIKAVGPTRIPHQVRMGLGNLPPRHVVVDANEDGNGEGDDAPNAEVLKVPAIGERLAKVADLLVQHLQLLRDVDHANIELTHEDIEVEEFTIQVLPVAGVQAIERGLVENNQDGHVMRATSDLRLKTDERFTLDDFDALRLEDDPALEAIGGDCVEFKGNVRVNEAPAQDVRNDVFSDRAKRLSAAERAGEKSD